MNDRAGLSVTIDLLKAFTRDPTSAKLNRKLRQRFQVLADSEIVVMRELSQATRNMLDQLRQATIDYDADVELVLKDVRSALKDLNRQIDKGAEAVVDGLDDILGRIDLVASGGYDFDDDVDREIKSAKEIEQPFPREYSPESDSGEQHPATYGTLNAPSLLDMVLPLQKSVQRKIDSIVRLLTGQTGSVSDQNVPDGFQTHELMASVETRLDNLKKLQQELWDREREISLRARGRTGVDHKVILDRLHEFFPSSHVKKDLEDRLLTEAAIRLCNVAEPMFRDLANRFASDKLACLFYDWDSQYTLEIKLKSEEIDLETLRKITQDNNVLSSSSILNDRDLVQFFGVYCETDTEFGENIARGISSTCSVEVNFDEIDTWTLTLQIYEDCCTRRVIPFEFCGDSYALYDDGNIDVISIGDRRVDLLWGEVKTTDCEYPILNRGSADEGNDVLLIRYPSPAAVVVTKVQRPQAVSWPPSANEFARPYGFANGLKDSNHLVLSPDDLVRYVKEADATQPTFQNNHRIQIIGSNDGESASLALQLESMGFDAICTATAPETFEYLQERHPWLVVIFATDENSNTVVRIVEGWDFRDTHLVVLGEQVEAAEFEMAESKTRHYVSSNMELAKIVDSLSRDQSDPAESQSAE